MILIYSEEITPRVDYIFRLFFTGILQVEIDFTTDAEVFRISDLPKLNYSGRKLADELYIKPHGLLHRKGLEAPVIKPVECNGQRYFFESSSSSLFPFDPFAASFYLVTRFEEYTETRFDRFGRYPAENSILYKTGLLKKPVIDIWAGMLADKFMEKYPGLIFPNRKFQFISTIDIDNAWAYRHKGFFRTTGAFFKSILKNDFKELNHRIRVLNGKEQDPYDTYDFLDSVLAGHEKQTRVFILLGNYNRFDKNISHRNRAFRDLIKRISGKYEVGIHPSFASNDKSIHLLIKEKKRLEKITGKIPRKSRQHFLKLRFPETCQRLTGAGIEEDYTMGYPSQTGFRAGTCTPFQFYDLTKEKATKLTIIPFQVMDVTLRDYLELDPEEALNEITGLMTEVKNTGGIFVSIWHNETISNLDRWKGYRQVFETTHKTGFEWSNE